MNVFLSVLTYELGRQVGISEAPHEFRRQVDDPKSPDNLPAARVAARLAELGTVMLYHGAGTNLSKARSRAAHAARKWLTEQNDSRRRVWVMCDDDVECDATTLHKLIAAAGSDRVAVLPCPIRGTASEQQTVNVVWDSSLVVVENGVRTRAASRAGCGLMVVPLGALERVMADQNRDVWGFDDDDGEHKLALFHQTFVDAGDRRLWLGEDYSFCWRLRAAGVPLVGIVEGIAIHDGVGLDLRLCQ